MWLKGKPRKKISETDLLTPLRGERQALTLWVTARKDSK